MEPKFFSFSRFGKMVKFHIYTNFKATAYFLGALLAFFTFIAVISLANGNMITINFFISIFGLWYAITASVIASMSFRELRDKKSATSYLTLPASVFEKYLTVWLYSIIVGIVGYLVMFAVFNLLLIFIGAMFKVHVPFFNFLQYKSLGALTIGYLVVNSEFLLGATIFKRSPFLQTILWMFIIAMALSFIFGPIAKLLLQGDFQNLLVGDIEQYSEQIKNIIETGAKVVIAAVTVLFWAAAYFKVKEKQVV